MNLSIEYYAVSDLGLVRKNNEDSVYAGPHLLALADGMGGHIGGEIASKSVISYVSQLDDADQFDNPAEQLNNIISEADNEIRELIRENPELTGMGTTLTAMLFSDSFVALSHIGDSRAYLLRDNELIRLTRDDTLVQLLVETQQLAESQVNNHPQRSIILKALTGDNSEINTRVFNVAEGDVFLLCSDGLTDVLPEDIIADALRDLPLAETGTHLVNEALKAGGPDNVSVVVAKVISGTSSTTIPIFTGAVLDETFLEEAPLPLSKSNHSKVSQATRLSRIRRRWLTPVKIGIALLAVLVIAVATFFSVQSNYYVDLWDKKVTIYRGLPMSIFSTELHSPAYLVCVDSTTAAAPQINFTEARSTSCNPLLNTDLSSTALQSIRELPRYNSLIQAKDQATKLSNMLLQPCSGPDAPLVMNPVPSGSKNATPLGLHTPCRKVSL